MKGSVFTALVSAADRAKTLETQYPGLIATAKVWTGPGDEVSRMILGLHNALRTGQLKTTGSLDDTLRKVESTTCVFGLVLSDIDSQREILLKIHKELGGVLLDDESNVYAI